MKLIPYKKLLIDSNLSKDSFRNRFESFAELNEFGSNQWYNNIFKKKSKKYVGTIIGNRFKLEPLVTYSRTPFLKVKGYFSEQAGKSKIEIELTLPLGVKITLLVIIIVGIFLLVMDYVIKSLLDFPTVVQEYPYVFLFPLILYMLVIFLFNIQSNFFLNSFLEHFEVG